MQTKTDFTTALKKKGLKVTKHRKIAKIPEKTGLLGAGAAQERLFYVMMKSQTWLLGRDGINSIHAEVFI